MKAGAMMYVNLGCGPVFVADPHWLNLDYSPVSASVRKADLLNPLPIESHSVDFLYSSHLIEHIPRASVPDLLSEVKRILKPGGLMRLVLPDFEEMCRSYLQHRDAQQHLMADFLVAEMIDQCVRKYPGGELAGFYRRLGSDCNSDQSMIDFVYTRTGETLGKCNQLLTPAVDYSQASSGLYGRLQVLAETLKQRIAKLRIQVGVRIAPSSFRRNNISYAATGELHQWLWDYYQVSSMLSECGFCNIRRVTHLTSGLADFPFVPLDADQEGRPRKGRESMYIEAQA